MSLPSIFAWCPTYGRPQCVSNLVHQWEQMEYDGHRELLILDDGNQYPLEPSGETWSIVSVSRRFASLGEKQNAAVSFSRPEHDLLVVLEDDDDYMPWTLKAHAEAFRHSPVSIPNWYFFLTQRGELRLHRNKKLESAHAGWSFSRDVFRRVSGYPWIDIPTDHHLLMKFWKLGITPADPTDQWPPYYVNRLRSSHSQHLSRDFGDDPWSEAEQSIEIVQQKTLTSACHVSLEPKVRKLISVPNGGDAALQMGWQQFKQSHS